MPPFALRSRRVITPTGIRPATVVVDGPTVGGVLDTPPPGLDVEDLGDRVLAPSLVDTHVHVNEPGRTEWEGFATATRAAATGGITALVDMPLNSTPVTTTVDALHAKCDAARGQLWVDCGFWGGVIPGNQPHLAPMVDAGVLGFKAFLCDSGIDEFPASDEAVLRAAMTTLAPLGVPLLAHCELDADLRALPPGASPRAYLHYLHSRPRQAEDRAIALLIRLSRETRCRVHVVHLSSGTAVPMIAAAKEAGVPITVETCPHYLCLTAEDVPDGATAFKCAPPVREATNRDALWAGLADGTIDLVVTDHSPCIPALKRTDVGDFFAAWGGIASLQLGLAAVWTEARARRIALPRVLSWMSRAPRALVGWPAPDGIVAGSAADLVAFDSEIDVEVRAADLRHRHPISPWIGRRLTGRVCHTWLRGTPILRDGDPWGDGIGRVVLGGRDG